MKKREKIILGAIAVLIIISVILLSYYYLSGGQRKVMKDLSIEKDLQGTSLQDRIIEVKNAVDSGKRTYTIQEVLLDRDGFICAIDTEYGPMTLEIIEGKIRQDILWGSRNTTAFIIRNDVYRYSYEYNEWLRFDYENDLASKQVTHGIFSEFELLNKTMPDKTVCVKAKISDQDFVFPSENALDVSKAARTISLP